MKKYFIFIILLCTMFVCAIEGYAAKYAMYLDPYSTEWSDTWCYVWAPKSSSTNYYYATEAIAAVKAEIDEYGWLKAEFETDSTVFDVYFCSNEITNSIYYSNSYAAGTNNLYQGITESTYFVIDNQMLKKSEFRPLNIVESNTFNLHVTTAGTLGNVIMSYIDDWGDVAKLTITGSLNKQDMKYFARMTYLQELDLSGTDISLIASCTGLKRLKKVVLPSSVTTVADSAFYGCVLLDDDLLLDNVETIGNFSFFNCNNIDTLSLPKCKTAGNGAFAFANYYNYWNTTGSNISYTDRGLKTIDMPIATDIGRSCFAACGRLEKINIPLAETIGLAAFHNCIALKEIDIHSATNIGDVAFGCYYNFNPQLSKVILSDELATIPSYCFYNAKNLTDINIPQKLKQINDYAFYDCKIRNVVLPEGTTTVQAGNFTHSDSITLPSTITTFASYSSEWKHVFSYLTPPPSLGFVTNSGNNFEDMTLHVPAYCLSAYKLNDYWYRFGKITAIEGNLDAINITGDFTFYTTDGIVDKAAMTIYSGGKLTTSADKTIYLGQYTQHIGTTSSYSWDYSKENGSYVLDENNNYISIYSKSIANTGSLMALSSLAADNAEWLITATANRWNFISLPFDVNIADITTQAGIKWVIREYNAQNRASQTGDTWQNVATDGVLSANKGYILYCNSAAVFTFPAANETRQNIFSIADQQVALEHYEADYPQNMSWNLIGNPYPCFFDIKKTDFIAPMTMWNGRGYTAYSPLDDDYILRPAEAFFVQAPEDADAIIFDKSGRNMETSYTVSTYEYNNRTSMPARREHNSITDRLIFNFIVGNTDYSDRARIVFNEQASTDYELLRDAAKMMSTDDVIPQLYVNEQGIHYSICERPMQNGQTILGFHAGAAGEYSLTLDAHSDDYIVQLTDNEYNIDFQLDDKPYIFTSQEGDFPERFSISIQQRMPTVFATITTDNSIELNGNQLMVRSSQLSDIRVYSIDGQIIVRRNGTNLDATLAAGVYIVCIDNLCNKVVVK